jgi:ABC-type transport system involved in multi-copper enzyme maturation permease subunit
MIWLTWRQARAQSVVLVAATLLLAAALAITGPQLIDWYRTNGEQFLDLLMLEDLYQALYLAGIAALYAAPALIGVFCGAPLVARELEAGTHRLVWTQSISRTRWLAVKLGLAGLVAVAATGVIALAVTWWNDPIQRAVAQGNSANLFGLPQIHPAVFGARGIVPVAYTLFALTLGTALGMLLRKTVLAMAITLAVVVTLQVIMPSLLRVHLMPTEKLLVAITEDIVHGIRGSGPPPSPDSDEAVRFETFDVELGTTGAWSLGNRTVKDGVVPAELPAWTEGCLVMRPGGSPESRQQEGQACFDRLAAEGYRQEVVAHPSGHFWPLQWRETGLLLALSALATGFCFWRIRRDFT